MIECNENTHTDRTDVSFEIALHEYGLVRNPDNNDTVFCLNTVGDLSADSFEDHEFKYSNFDISLQDVKEALEEASPGYFSFIGSTKKKEIEKLDNDYLSIHIFSLNQYSGVFDPHTY